ncbi:restriction endonuclease subunit S [Rodentibacter caecimuris]|uniref:restriction endonuclease subunit S n=1 Tax=Rodentibacter caecimuris TaxID=1796644 RepID=UPI001094E16F|nr:MULTISPECIES: restriction endonuclease subunit S [Pasteurellaceae]MCQ9122591.1 restriction endonuclease subunit S [Rodentibacter heylii]TGY50491.1 restriction endonuclease subunit S [Pasteurella caecimuris]
MEKLVSCQLGDLIEFQRGYDLPRSEFVEGEYPVQSSNGILGYHNEYKVIAPGITIGRSGTVGIPHLLRKNFFPHNTALFVKDFKGNDVEYIYYLLRYLDLGNRKSGSGVPTMNRNHLHPLKIKAYRDLIKQQKIANILSTLDRKIALNQQINQKLEAIAKQLYDYWFVQFDFPDENGKPYKSSGGEMVWCEVLKRDVPKGWEVSTLSTWIGNDKTGDWGKEQAEGNYQLQVGCIRGADINGINGDGRTSMPTRFILPKNESKLLSPYDFVIEISGGSPTQSTGRLAGITEQVLNRFANPLICSNFCKAISLKDQSYFFNFMYLWKSIYDNNILFGWEGKTSGIKNLLFDAFVSKYEVVKPTKQLVEKFSETISLIDIKKQQSLNEIQKLTQLRDFLLPMLMNGQIFVE